MIGDNGVRLTCILPSGQCFDVDDTKLWDINATVMKKGSHTYPLDSFSYRWLLDKNHS